MDFNNTGSPQLNSVYQIFFERFLTRGSFIGAFLVYAVPSDAVAANKCSTVDCYTINDGILQTTHPNTYLEVLK